MHKKLLILMICMVLFSGIVASAPPIFEVNIADGFYIEPTIKDYIRTGEDHEFEIHIINISNGYPITEGVSCYMHLYHEGGDHEFEGFDNTVEHDFDYSFLLNGTNFTSRGVYQAKFQCNSSALGGATEIEFGVNDYGEELTKAIESNHNWSMAFLMIFFLLSLVGLFMGEHPASKLACYWFAHLLFIIGTFSIWQFNQGYALSYTVLAGVFKILFYVSIIAVFPMVLLSVVLAWWMVLMNDDIKKFMDKGMDEDEAYSRAKEKRKW